MSKYSIKVNDNLIKQLKPYWEQLQVLGAKFSKQVYKLEQKASKETGIKGIEFFMCDGSYMGIGNVDRSMRLIQRNELE